MKAEEHNNDDAETDGEDEEDDNEQEDDDDEDDNDEEDDDDEDLDEEDDDTDPKKKNNKFKNSQDSETWKGDKSVERPSDVHEGKTIFVRNLDFSTTQDSFKHFMEQFGEVHYALLCMDKLMERPKGTGFVKFKVFFRLSKTSENN